MFLNWFRDRRRRALLSRPFPPEWLDILRHNVHAYESLSFDKQAKIRAYLQIFVAEKNWEGCGGLKITAEVQVTIAAQVAILVLGLDSQYFDRVMSILVYPTTYNAPSNSVNEGGLVTEGGSDRLGEAWYRGPVILVWDAVLAAGRQELYGNVVYHEFAHQLDMLNGSIVDGTPPLESAEQDRRWTDVSTEQYQQLVQACEQGHRTLIDCYGATSPSEFFAVATETFFVRPHALRHYHPSLFEILQEFYRQDPQEFIATE